MVKLPCCIFYIKFETVHKKPFLQYYARGQSVKSILYFEELSINDHIFTVSDKCLLPTVLALSQTKPTLISQNLFDSIHPFKLRFDSQIITYDKKFKLVERYGFRNKAMSLNYGDWSPLGGLALTRPGAALYERRVDLGGSALTCAVKHAPPTMIISRDDNGRVRALEGKVKQAQFIKILTCVLLRYHVTIFKYMQIANS